MTDHRAAAITAAAKVLATWWSDGSSPPDADDISVATRMLEAAEPHNAAAEVKAVQQWMALDLWMALGKDSQDFEPFAAGNGWDETWSACLA